MNSRFLIPVFFAIILLVPVTVNVFAFETEGGPGAVHPTLEALEIGKHLGSPIHQDITREGLDFLKEDIKERLADVHVDMERDQSSINHFDNCEFRGTVGNINGYYRTALTNLNPDNFDLAVAGNAFGSALHPIQDFYSHSNWIEMNKTGLVDPWYSYWRDIGPFSFTSHTDNLVFSLEVPPNGNTRSVFYASNALSEPSEEYGSGDSSGSYIDKTIRVKENNTSYPRIGLISGTYGEPEESRCPSDASIPHGSVIRPVYTYADDETLNHPNELNKDNPERTGHTAARNLATQQTTHEFCRLVELVKGSYGDRGVSLIYQNWVHDQEKANEKCPPIQVSVVSLPSGGVHIAEGLFIEPPNSGMRLYEDGTIWDRGIITLPDGTTILPDGSSISPQQRLVPNPQVTNLQEQPIESKQETKSTTIPNWIKNNADWWEQGLITDKDFASGLGFMVKEQLIHVDNVDFDPNGDIEISDDIEIPDWIKNNARWWVDGVISDDDFKFGIQHMVKEEVISFKKRPITSTHDISSDRSLELNSDNIKNLYKFNKWNELTATWLLEVKNAESELSDELAKDTWNVYSEDKNQALMIMALELDDIQKDAISDANFLVGVLTGIKNIEYALKENAKDLGMSPQELESLSKTAIDGFDAVKRLHDLQDIEDGYKQVDKAQKQSDNKKIQINSAVDDSDDYIVLDNYSQFLIDIFDNVVHDSNTLISIIDKGKNITEKLNDSIIDKDKPQTTDDYLLGLDDDIEDSQTESINNDVSNDSTIPDNDITNDDFTIEANPMSLTLSNGEYGEILVKTKSLYGWESPVQITIPVIPSPMTYPPGYPHYVYPTPESETSSIISVQISGNACTGTYILRVFGYGEHPAPDRVLEVHSVNVEINTIREPSLELGSLENPITIVQGGSHTFQLSFKSLDYADYSYIVGHVDGFSPPSGVVITTPPTFVSVPEQTTVYAPVTITVSASTAPTTFEIPIYAETGLDCYNPYGETTSVTVNIIPMIDEETEMVQLIPITALSISDQQYPISQFTLWQWEGECDDQWHYHSPTGYVVALDGLTGISDPDQENCGFGKASSFANLSAWMSQSQIDNFKAQTGYDPLNSEAIMGGSGP